MAMGPLGALGTEMDVGWLRPDVVARNPRDNSRVLIGNQLEHADRHHLGRVVAYLAGLQGQDRRLGRQTLRRGSPVGPPLAERAHGRVGRVLCRAGSRGVDWGFTTRTGVRCTGMPERLGSPGTGCWSCAEYVRAPRQTEPLHRQRLLETLPEGRRRAAVGATRPQPRSGSHAGRP